MMVPYLPWERNFPQLLKSELATNKYPAEFMRTD